MNKATRKLKAKGYTLPEGVKALGISLSSFRKYEKEGNKHYDDLLVWIDELEVNNINYCVPLKEVSKSEYKLMYPEIKEGDL